MKLFPEINEIQNAELREKVIVAIIKAGLPAEVVHCIESHRELDSFERSYEAKIILCSDRLHADAMLKVHPEVSIM